MQGLATPDGPSRAIRIALAELDADLRYRHPVLSAPLTIPWSEIHDTCPGRSRSLALRAGGVRPAARPARHQRVAPAGPDPADQDRRHPGCPSSALG